MIEGKVSSPLPATSCVRLRSIIRPLLVVLYIKDICTSFMKLYADGAKYYRKIKLRQDVFLYR